MKKIVSLFLLFIITTSHALASTISTTSPYPGDYIIAYNTSIANSASAGEIVRSELVPSDDGIDSFLSDIEAFAEFDINPVYSRLRTIVMSDTPLPVDSTRTFRAFDLRTTNGFINIPATLLAVGDNCYIWVKTTEIDSIGKTKANRLAEEFDQNIRGQMVTNFGDYFSNEDRAAGSVNGRIDILVYDIQSSGSGLVLGYFNKADYLTSADFTSAGVHDNSTGVNGALLHLNSYDVRGAEPIRQRSFETLAHEFTHLVNFTAATKAPSNVGTNYGTRKYHELWLDEALAMAAESMIYGPLTSRVTGYYSSAMVRTGGALVYKEYGTNLNDVGANYGLPYMFSQYLRTQTTGLKDGGDAIFKEILSSNNMDAAAVTSALSKIGYPVTNFSDLNRNFRIATFLNEPSGYFGYNGRFTIANHSTLKNSLIYEGDNRTLLPSAAIIMARGSKTFSSAGADTSLVKYAGFGGLGVTPTPTPTIRPPSPSPTMSPSSPTPTRPPSTPRPTARPTPTTTSMPQPTSISRPTATPTTAPIPRADFRDMENFSWADNAVDVLSYNNIINGVKPNEFAPYENIKRGDFILIMARLFGFENTRFTYNFNDVPPDTYYYKAIGAARSLGIIVGDGSNFKPESLITREDMFVMASRIMYLEAMELQQASTSVLSRFNDRDQISPYADSVLATLVVNNFIEGSGGNITPLNNANRAEAAVFVYRIYERIK